MIHFIFADFILAPALGKMKKSKQSIATSRVVNMTLYQGNKKMRFILANLCVTYIRYQINQGLLFFLVICSIGIVSCSDEDRRTTLFSQAKPYLTSCQSMIELNDGKKPINQQWKASVTALIHLKPKIIVSRRGDVFLFEILNAPLDLYEAFVYVSPGTKIDDYLKDKAWLQRKAITKKMADNWYWIMFDS